MPKCLIEEIATRADKAGIPFLIIGGYAVIAHGYVRTTEDLDLITERGQRARFAELLDGMRMSPATDAPNFAQFTSPDESSMDVDLMFVSEDVFRKLESASVETKIENIVVRVVSLPHLIALKCHAIQNSQSRLRVLKDMDDLVRLIILNRLDLNDPELRATILRHANSELYEKLRRTCAE